MVGSEPPRKRDRTPSFDSAYVLIPPPESAHSARMAQPHTDMLPFKQFAKPRARNNSGVLNNRAKQSGPVRRPPVKTIAVKPILILQTTRRVL